MVVWLRRDAPLGIDGDVIRAADRHHVVALDDAWQALLAEREAVLEAARAEADAILADARAVATGLIKEAHLRSDNSARLGYAAGQRKALADFHASMAARAFDDAESAQRLEARLQAMVMQTVERVVQETDRQALFARVAAELGKVLQNQARLTVRVCAAELESARAAFAAATKGGALSAQVEVLADDRAEPGDCQCEWDHGVADASLRVQLAALRQALSASRSRAHAAPAREVAGDGERQDIDGDDGDEDYEGDA